jgi:hypothetical protein
MKAMTELDKGSVFLCDTPGRRTPCLHERAFAGQRTANGFAVSCPRQSMIWVKLDGVKRLPRAVCFCYNKSYFLNPDRR